jgi:HPt (histidine-containing phosphotransfer) domain-containing protein
MLHEMDHAIVENDADKLRLVSHSLKTNSAQFGATALFELCRDIEMQAKKGEIAAPLVAEAQAEYENAHHALENLREV